MQLKSIEKDKDGSGFPARFGALLTPELAAGEVSTDSELYAAVEAHGCATVATYASPGFKVESIGTLTPEQFKAQWKGD